ncbi:(2Fe-2S)-binding protein [Cohnella thermotolerans]|jgi:carbon-monoxide dehydrogenase small subunit|uniref:(2Fe-2S)-binding protein n=1 Tax=Cohnella thermotolerans TaxID=329858 RepID=UPI0004119D18|nr:(2Fe-2S)-binding protein [Cohnella thermotolerans]
MTDKTLAERSAPSLLECEINGEKVSLAVPPTRRLLDLLRDDLQLTGTKRSCDIGRCGACMVLIDGKPFNSCLTMAYQCSGKSVTTIEGLAEEERLHPVQQCFLEEGGYQCGYCTPGMIVSVKALLDANPQPTMEEIEEALSGNLCRCTGYGGILRSVARAIETGGAASNE